MAPLMILSKRLKKDESQIQNAYGDSHPKNGPKRRNGLMTKFHFAFYFVCPLIYHVYAPVILCTIILASLRKGWG